MPHYVYVAAQDDNKVGIYTMDADTGGVDPPSRRRHARRPVAAGHQP